MSQPRARSDMAPAERRARHHPAEIFSVDLFENLFEMMYGAQRPRVGLPAPRLPDEVDLPPHVLPIKVKPVSMRVLRGRRLAVEFAQQDVRERFGYRRRRDLQQVGNANPDRAALEAHVAVRIRKSLVFDLNGGCGRARPDLAVNAPEDFAGRFEEERALNIHRREKMTLYLTAIDHNKRLLNFLSMAATKPVISAVGCYVPPGVLTNSDLEKMVQTDNEWIIDRTGISERHIAAPDVATSDLATCAAKAVLANRGIDASELDAILVCTVTPDMLFPSTACLVQHNLGASKAWGFDLVAACSGFVYGLTTGASFIAAGTHRKVLVIGADTMSRIINYEDRATCILFGDGAGAMLLEAGGVESNLGFVDFIGEIDGSGGSFLKMPAGGSRMPASEETVARKLHYVHQEGAQVFKYAVLKMHEVCTALLERNGLSAADLDLLIPHQANRRIIYATAERLGLPIEKVMINIGKYGNTTAGTIPLATRDAIAEGRLKKGDLVMFAAVGAGYTVGASLWRWAF